MCLGFNIVDYSGRADFILFSQFRWVMFCMSLSEKPLVESVCFILGRSAMVSISAGAHSAP